MRRSDDASRGRTPSPLDDGTRSYAVIGDVVVSERYVVLLKTAGPLGGRCPACDGVMDATGCRIGDHRRVDRAARRRTGIAQLVEVFCTGVPKFPVEACPSCEGHAS